MLCPRLLVVADCDGLEDTLQDLRRHGFEAEVATTGAEALRSFHEFDFVLVDLEFSEFDGITLCREIRGASDIPMIAFASYQLDRVLALETGCDDCVLKPYHSRELMARLRVVLRRVHMMTPPTLIAGQLEINSALREVRLDGHLIKLTRKEFELVRLLAAEPHKVFSRADLLQQVWGYDRTDATVTSLASRTIDTHLSSVRRKLGSPDWIVTVHGVGFRFNDAMRGRPVHAGEGAGDGGRAVRMLGLSPA